MKNKMIKRILVCSALSALLLAGCGQTAPEKKENTSTSSSQTVKESAPVVETSFGKVKGQVSAGVRTWLGVPYGGDVSGENRWQAPSNPEKWTEVLDATKAGDVAIQVSNGEVVGSENALNLDIYRPDSEAKDLPVLVFIHGGNNQTGKSTEISGASFVKNHEAIVVSVNYRLGVLGFNPLPALQTGSDAENSGNYSLLDIAKSLEWVRENITAFGGDSKNVTLSGFSAGGRDVMATLISPTFKGLYDKAISFSGGMTLAKPEASQEVFATALAPLVVEDGKQADEASAKAWLLSEDSAVKDYLVGVEAGRLAALMGNASIRMAVFPHLYTDGTVLPTDGFDTETYNDVPLLNLTGTNEFSLFGRFDKYFAASVADKTIDTDSDKKAQYDFVNKYGGMLYGLSNVTEASQKLLTQGYRSDIYSAEMTFGEDAEVVGDGMAPLGAFHGVFVPLLDTNNQNYAALVGDAYASEGAQALASDFQDYIFNFISTGNPNGDGLTKWTRFNDKQQLLQLGASKTVVEAQMIDKSFKYDDVLSQIAADTTVDEASKDILIKQVLNGRWFSYGLDQSYDNLSEFSAANGS